MVKKRNVQQIAETNDQPQVITSLNKLIHWNELEEWQKDNEFIHTGYIKSQNSFKAVLHSLGYFHNESVNIYTHLIPSIATVLLIGTLYRTLLSAPPFLLFGFGCATCMGMSAAFHTLKSHSHHVSIIGNKFDYLGICILIASSMLALLHYAYDDKPFQYRIFVGITLSLCAACSILSLLDRFRSREYRSTRATMFVCYGLSGVLPIIVGMFEFGYKEVNERTSCNWLYAEAFFYIFGAFLYAIRFPEKCNPGKYDLVGHSHQIFHILVVVAAWCHYNALLGAQTNSLQRKFTVS